MASHSRFWWDSPVFWVLYLVAAFFVAIRSVEIGFGLVVLLLGVHALGGELRRREQARELEGLQETLRQLRDWLERDLGYRERLRQRYDSRFFHLTERLKERRQQEKESDRQLEAKYRDVVKKVLELDNRLRELSRALLTPPPRSGKGRKR